MNAGEGGYFLYATQSNDRPGNSIGSNGNQANGNIYLGGYAYSYSTRATPYYPGSAGSLLTQNFLTDVGAFSASSSYYGTYDQNGNLWEWNDLDGRSATSKGIRGGNWAYDFEMMRAVRRLELPAAGEEFWDSNGTYYGFRLASGPAPAADITVLNGSLTQGEAGFPLIAGDSSLRKQGKGTLFLNEPNPITGDTEVWQGELVLAVEEALAASRVAVSNGAKLSISPGVRARVEGLILTPTANLDLLTGAITVSSDFTPDQAKSELLKGRGDGSWNGVSGIRSSSAAADIAGGIVRSVGWKANPDGSVTVAYAAPGDTNLDGEVNVFDLVNVNGSGTYGRGNPSNWSQGDFDYNGVTNIFDMVQTNGAGVYGRGNYLPATPPSVNAVPEPSACLLALAGFAGGYGLWRRR